MKNLKLLFGLTNICLFFLGTGIAYARWDVVDGTGNPTPSPYSESPQSACDYVSLGRFGSVVRSRIAWVSDMGYSSGLYTPGFDVQGPPIPNPENNYAVLGAPQMYCIFYESIAYRLLYEDEAANLRMTLTGSTETRPAGTGGQSEIALTAKVLSGSAPKPGVALSFSVDVTSNSGGHDHDDPTRPKGTLSKTQGTTDANGEVKVTFTAPQLAGKHTIKATCATCSNTTVTKEVQVKVPDLLPISPNPPQNDDGTFVYALTSVDQMHQGNGRYHHQQYYLTEQSRQNLRAMIDAFATEGWGTVALNDASLFWGGRYDIRSNWGAPHKGHRDGREIDISFVRANNPISASKQNIFYDKFCKNKKVNFPFSILHHYVLIPHFHVFLEKQQACFRSEQ